MDITATKIHTLSLPRVPPSATLPPAWDFLSPAPSVKRNPWSEHLMQWLARPQLEEMGVSYTLLTVGRGSARRSWRQRDILRQSHRGQSVAKIPCPHPSPHGAFKNQTSMLPRNQQTGNKGGKCRVGRISSQSAGSRPKLCGSILEQGKVLDCLRGAAPCKACYCKMKVTRLSLHRSEYDWLFWASTTLRISEDCFFPFRPSVHQIVTVNSVLLSSGQVLSQTRSTVHPLDFVASVKSLLSMVTFYNCLIFLLFIFGID